MDNSNRPLSPHLQIYRLPLTAWLSISHRITGTLLSIGMLLFAVSLIRISTGAQSFAAMQQFLASTSVQVLLVILLFSLFFHWCHGIRHLIMDIGKSLEKRTMTRYAVFEIALSVFMTAISAAIIWAR